MIDDKAFSLYRESGGLIEDKEEIEEILSISPKVETLIRAAVNMYDAAYVSKIKHTFAFESIFLAAQMVEYHHGAAINRLGHKQFLREVTALEDMHYSL